MKKGYIQIYTGNGKGKTTAAIGVAVRSLCAGRRVYMGQFIKSMKYNETKLDRVFDSFCIEQFGSGCFINREPEEKDIELAQRGLEHCREVLLSGEYELVILDELNVALYYKLVSLEEVLQLMEAKTEQTELIITGRYAPAELIERADLVTEMKEVKHYFHEGVMARNGIER